MACNCAQFCRKPGDSCGCGVVDRPFCVYFFCACNTLLWGRLGLGCLRHRRRSGRRWHGNRRRSLLQARSYIFFSRRLRSCRLRLWAEWGRRVASTELAIGLPPLLEPAAMPRSLVGSRLRMPYKTNGLSVFLLPSRRRNFALLTVFCCRTCRTARWPYPPSFSVASLDGTELSKKGFVSTKSSEARCQAAYPCPLPVAKQGQQLLVCEPIRRISFA